MGKRKNALEQLKREAPEKLTMGQRIRLLRGDRTQAEFSMLLDKSQDILSMYEVDRVLPSIDVLSRIAEMSHVTLDWLVHGRSDGSRRNGAVVFKGYIIKPKTLEWQILEMLTSLRSHRVRQKAARLVNSFISIARKK
ncbi:MAG: helix-turn-helix domain-containing protein [Deltaproteobacteria bacterium]|nr:helix-turn-helix domain-containing protein [Deltaproteobacteria bacterium]